MDVIDKTLATARNYQMLASKIVEVACADYIDAQIVIRQGYVSEDEFINKIFRKVIKYGERRYVYKDYMGLHRSNARAVNKKLREIKNMLKNDDRQKAAQVECEEIERFFHSPQFAIYMPNTDPDILIRGLKRKAMANERIKTGYPANF